MPAALDRYYTRDEVLAFPHDGNRYELVHGELLVTPAPDYEHQDVVLALASELRAYTMAHAAGHVMISPADLSWGRVPDVIVQPDIFVVAPDDAGKRVWSALRHFSLFVEVLSPSSARNDRFTKRRLYQEMGVPLYWVIDLPNRRVESWRPDSTSPEYEYHRLTWQPEGATAPFTLEVARLFRA